MPRDSVSITVLNLNGNVTTPSGVAINPTNGANITNANKHRKLLVRVTNTITNATHTVTFRAGAYPPAMRSGIGDLSVALAASDDQLIELESGRFLQTDGSINVDYHTGMTGAISAIRLAPGNS